MAERTRSEYRLSIAPGQFTSDFDALVKLQEQDRDALAQLMLDGYQGTVDDEDETFEEALAAIDHYLGICMREHSVVLKRNGAPIAMSLVLMLNFNQVHYIDPVVVAAPHKGAGLGRRLVEASLASLSAAGVREVGATITDGNEPSERLFARLGATRVGPWPPSTD